MNLLILLLLAGAAADWPMFRGPNSGGHAKSTAALPTEFGPGKNEAWQVELPPGHSSPVVSGELIFLTGVPPNSNNLETIAVNRRTGKIAWRRTVEAQSLEHTHQISNPATATCATDGTRVISYFGSFGLVGYDVSGHELWRYPMPGYESLNGSGTSPLLFENTVYLNREDAKEQVLIALDVKTGVEKWKRAHPNAQANLQGVTSTPIAWKNQILIHRGGSLTACDTQTGEVAWFLAANTTGCSTPVISEGKLVLSTWNHAGEADQAPPLPEFSTLLGKYDSDKDGKVSETEFPDDFPILIRPELDSKFGGNTPFKGVLWFFDDNKDKAIDEAEWKSGLSKATDYLKSQRHGVLALDLEKSAKPTDQNIIWKVERNVPEVPSPLVHHGRVYLIRNGGILMCVDLASGEKLYQERLGAAGPYYASPIEADNHIYLCAGSGKIAVLRDRATFDLIALNDLREEIFATPAAVEDQLIVRTKGRLYAFSLAGAKP